MKHPFLVHDYLSLSAEKFPDKEALICEEIRLTYRQLDSLSDLFAHGLLEQGIRHQDRVIVFCDNSWEVVVALYGILKAGGIFVILNGAMKAPKLRYIIEDSGASFLVTHTNKAAVKAAVIKASTENLNRPLQIVWTGDPAGIPVISVNACHSWDNFHGNRNKNGVDDPAGRNELRRRASRTNDLDLAALIYTSGSTGEPKGVMSPHRSMLAVARSIIQYLENQPEDVIIDALPLSFDYGLYQVLMAVIFGGTIVLERSFIYPVKVLERMEKEKVTGFPIVPTMAALLLSMQNIQQFDLCTLRYLTNTAAALPVDHLRRLRGLFPQARLYSMYGLTECKRVSFLPPEELDRRPSSVGKAIPNCEVFVVDENGKEVPPGVVGELVIRGANVMAGYWRAPELTARTFREERHSRERLLYSGDLFQKDKEGFLYFVGRKDDLIKTRGERVSPKEVENMLCQIDGVAEAAVIGVPDEILGQAVKAFVILEGEKNIGEREIKKWCADHLEPFMVPKFIEFLKEFPKNSNGKVDRRALASNKNDALGIPFRLT